MKRYGLDHHCALEKAIAFFGSQTAMNEVEKANEINLAESSTSENSPPLSNNNSDLLKQCTALLEHAQEEMEMEMEVEREVEMEREQIKNVVAPVRPSEPQNQMAYKIFDHWKFVMKHPNSVLDKHRRALIQRALRDGYSLQQLCNAITGCSYTPHNMGDNDRGQRYDGLHIILRNSDQIDRFIANFHHPPHPLTATEKIIQKNVNVAEEWLNEHFYQEGEQNG